MRFRLCLSLIGLASALVIGCSSRGGEALFDGEGAGNDGLAGAGGDDGSGDDEDAGTDSGEATDDADVDPPETDAGDLEDAPDDAAENEGGGELPPASLTCGNATCTTPGQYCCLPAAGVNIGSAATCKDAGSDCKLGPGNWMSGIPQKCGAHEHCGGGQCCAIRKDTNSNYTSVECKLKCEGAEVEVCDPKNPKCSSGTCKQSQRVSALYLCQP